MKKVAYTVMVFMTASIFLAIVGCSDRERVHQVKETDYLGRTNKVKSNERVFEIEVVDVQTGDTIILHYTTNSSRYTKAYKK